MTYAEYRKSEYVPFEVLDRLIAADLDKPQDRITRDEYDRAMRIQDRSHSRLELTAAKRKKHAA